MHGSFDYQEVTDKLIEENEFDADQKDAFKVICKKKPIDRLEKPRKRPCRNELID
ncbi:hypothetical protein CK203_107462 [Vitis vinifera]|uniref:Uncharacterized protein n=1 Tax=Vitis vinifera TaxID=29760 RepID=A0A438EHD3_VITVI|nr:hypothetical protein CK203_107462 [Vitis vinifera]